MRIFVGSIALFLLVGCMPASDEQVVEAALPPPSASSRGETETQSGSGKSKTLRTTPRAGEVVYYRISSEEIDRSCGAFDRSYVVEHVAVPKGRTDVLELALRALFREEWGSPQAIDSVNLEGGLATIDLRSSKGIKFASTTCGGTSFRGSLLRTVFQFDEVREVRALLRRSCTSFGRLMESDCQTYRRADLRLPQRTG